MSIEHTDRIPSVDERLGETKRVIRICRGAI
jgi:hypothetical protein